MFNLRMFTKVAQTHCYDITFLSDFTVHARPFGQENIRSPKSWRSSIVSISVLSVIRSMWFLRSGVMKQWQQLPWQMMGARVKWACVCVCIQILNSQCCMPDYVCIFICIYARCQPRTGSGSQVLNTYIQKMNSMCVYYVAKRKDIKTQLSSKCWHSIHATAKGSALSMASGYTLAWPQ